MIKVKAKNVKFGDFILTDKDMQSFGMVIGSLTINNKTKISYVLDVLMYYGFVYETMITLDENEIVDIIDDIDHKNEILLKAREDNISSKNDVLDALNVINDLWCEPQELFYMRDTVEKTFFEIKKGDLIHNMGYVHKVKDLIAHTRVYYLCDGGGYFTSHSFMSTSDSESTKKYTILLGEKHKRAYLETSRDEIKDSLDDIKRLRKIIREIYVKVNSDE